MPAPHNQDMELADIKRKAKSLCQNGEFLQAKDLLEEHKVKGGIDAEFHAMLGPIYGQLRDFKAAIMAYQEAIRLQPLDPHLHFGHGKALGELGQLLEAESSFKTALDLQPSFSQAVLELATTQFKLNKLAEAERGFQQILESESESVKALLGLGMIYQIWRMPELATNYYKNALSIDPQNALAEYQIGRLLLLQAQHEEAGKHLRAVLDIDPNYIPAYLALGDLHITCNRIPEAKKAYKEAITKSPDYTPAISGMAKVCELSGEIETAYEHIAPLIERGVKDIGLGMVFASICRHYGLCQQAIDYLEQLLADNQKGTGFNDQIHFSLGKLYDSLGEYEKAFFNYKKGNDLKRDTFNPIEHTASISSVIKMCDWRFFTQAPRSANNSERPVFIVGMPRSGTTLTEQILSCHPKVYGAGELPIFPDIIKSLPCTLGAPYPENLKNISTDFLGKLSDNYLETINQLNAKAPKVIDKSLVNFLYLGLISLVFPKARVIHCIRDPRDTCLSIYFQNFDESHNYATKLENIGHYYREYMRIMQHWKSLLDIPILEVRYEDIVKDQEAVSRKLIEFLGIEWNEQVLKFYESKRNVVTASYDQVRQKIYTRSAQRWKNYDAHIQPLLTVLGDINY